MTKWMLGLAALAVAIAAATPPSFAQSRRDSQTPSGEATVRDLQRLQQDIENLDDALEGVEKLDPTEAQRLRQRADEIRDDAVYLKVKMRRAEREGNGRTGVSIAEVDDLRRDIDDLRADIDSRTSVRRSADMRVPAGTELSIRLEESLSSKDAVIEDRFRASVQRPVRIGDAVAIPAGSELRGIVRSSQPAERPQKAGRLDLDFDSLYIDHTRVDLRTSLVSMQDEDAGHDVPRKAGIGAVLGGVIGGLLKGRTGAVIGVLVGGGAVVAQKGEDVELPEGTILKVRLERPVTVPVVGPGDRDRERERDRSRD
jgi:hypothetical protein